MKTFLRVLKVFALIVIGFLIVGSIAVLIGDRLIKSYQNPVYGLLHKEFVKTDTVIQSYPCRRGKVTHYDNGAIMSFTLAQDHVMDSNLIPGGSHVTMYYTGFPEFIRLTDNATINGYHVSNSPKELHWHLSFYNDGSLASFIPLEDVVIDGYKCLAGEWVELLPDGSVLTFRTASPLEVSEKQVDVGTKLLVSDSLELYSLKRHREVRNAHEVGRYTFRLCCP